MLPRMRIYNLVCFLAALFLTAYGLEAQQASSDAIGEHVQAGRQALESGNLKAAISEFRKVVALDPSLYQARVNLGLAYHASGDPVDAVAALAKARESSTQLGGANLVLGSDYLELGKPKLAIDPLRDAVRDGIGGQETKAKLCTAYVQAERFREASQCGAELYGAPPTTADGWYQLGRLYLDSAQTLTLSMRSKFPNDRWTKRLDGDVAAQNANRKLADRYYGEAGAIAKSTSPSPEPESRAEHDYWLVKQFLDQSNECFNRLLTQYPSSALAYRLKAESEEIRDNVQGAIENYQRAAKLASQDPTLHVALATLLLKQNRAPEAQAEAGTALALKPDAPAILTLVGKVDLALGNAADGEKRARRAITLEPAYLPAHELLGRILWRQENAAGAAAELQQALPLDHYGDIHYLLYRAYQKEGRTALAQQALAESRRLRQQNLAYAQEQVAGGAPDYEK